MASRVDSAAGGPDNSKPSGSSGPRNPPTKTPQKTTASEAEGVAAVLPGPQGGPSCPQSQKYTCFKSPPAKGLPAESHSGAGARTPQAPQAVPSGQPNVLHDISLYSPRLVRLPSVMTTSGSTAGCSVPGCPSNEYNTTGGLWLFALPCQQTESSLRAAWMERVPIDLEANGPHGPYVCFRHFASKDLVYRGRFPIGIRRDAMPSVPVATKSKVQLNYLLPKPCRNTSAALGVASMEKAGAVCYTSKSTEECPPCATGETGGVEQVVPSDSFGPERHKSRHPIAKKVQHVPSHSQTPAGERRASSSSKMGGRGREVPPYRSVGAANGSHGRSPGLLSAQEPHNAPGQLQAPVGAWSTPTQGATANKDSTETGDRERAVLFHPSMGHYHIEKKLLGEEGGNPDDRPVFFRVSWVPNKPK